MNIDFSEKLSNFRAQFRNLDSKDPSTWPAVPRYFLLTLVALSVIGLLWYLWLSGVSEQLDVERAKEVSLRQDYSAKVAQAVNLDELKRQRAQVLQYVNLLEKQLPSKAEMDALLSDINQAGLGRSLQFDVFRPGSVVVKDYYAELPIALRITGKYHDIGSFTSDIANLSRIVTLNNMSIAPSSGVNLMLDATVRTFRYLDPDEVNAQRNAKGAKK